MSNFLIFGIKRQEGEEFLEALMLGEAVTPSSGLALPRCNTQGLEA